MGTRFFSGAPTAAQSSSSGASSLPVRIDRVDVATGSAELWREIAPTDRTGMTEVSSVRISADESTLAYTVQRLFSELYLADGLR